MQRFVLAGLFGVIVLIAVLLVRASQFQWIPKEIPPAPKLRLDKLATAERLAQALRIPTITKSSTPAFDASQFQRLRNLLEANYPKTHATLEKRLINEHALLYRWLGSDSSLKPILLMAHQDVVPVPKETSKDWKYPPFSGTIADDHIWGRGSLDVKSGLVGILEAVEHLLKEGFKPKRSIYLAFGHDEEIGGYFGARAIANLLQKKNIRLEFVLDEGGSITEGIIPGINDPVALIGISEKGFVSLELSVKTEGGHSSMPPKALAIEIISRAITKLYDNPFPDQMEQSLTFFDYIGPKLSFTKRIIFANRWLFKPLIRSQLSKSKAMNASIRTTIAPTIFNAGMKDNVLPSSASAVVNFRIAPGDTIESVTDHVKRSIGDDRVTIQIYGDQEKAFTSNPSPVSPVDTKAFELIQSSIRAVSQDAEMLVAPYLLIGAADARYFTPLSDNVYRFLFNRLKGDELKLIHGTNERISVDNFSQTVLFYYRILKHAQDL